MKKKIFNLIILDESGSMQSIRKEAVDSVNETVQTIRKAQRKHEEQAHYVTLVTFNDTAHTQYACVPAAVESNRSTLVTAIEADAATASWLAPM